MFVPFSWDSHYLVLATVLLCCVQIATLIFFAKTISIRCHQTAPSSNRWNPFHYLNHGGNVFASGRAFVYPSAREQGHAKRFRAIFTKL